MNQKGPACRQAGFAPIVAIVVVVFIAGLALWKTGAIAPNTPKSKEIEPSSTPSATIKPLLEPTAAPKILPTTPKLSVPIPTSIPTPTPIIARPITLSGFAYEDTNNNSIHDTPDANLPNMGFYFYDSAKQSEQISTVFTDQSGNFAITLPVKGNLIIKPITYNDFRPISGSQSFSVSTSDLKFGFRSVNAPAVNQSGIIEGDVFQDNNQNNSRDPGEQGIYFYKLYLKDEDGNFYGNSSENAQATDAGGHFKYMNLPQDRTFILQLSNPTGTYLIPIPETKITLTNTYTQNTNMQIPVLKR